MDQLFDMETVEPFEAGQRIIAQTIWGDQPGHVLEVARGEGETVARVQIDHGPVLLMSTTRLVHDGNDR